MRKILGFLFLAAAVGFVAGCTSSTPEIKSIAEISDLPTLEAEVNLDLPTVNLDLPTIEGTVRYEYSTVPQPEGLTLQGTVYGEKRGGASGDPLEGVTINISGNSLTRVTTTSANGEFSFTGLPQNPEGGFYIIVASLDGWQTNRDIISIGSGAALPDNTVAVWDMLMQDNPIVLSIDPLPGSVIDAGETLNIEVRFNEAMDPSTVVPQFRTNGIRTYAIEDTVALNTSWTDGNRVLNIEVVGDVLRPNMFYRLILDQSATARDTREFPIDTNGGSSDALGGLTDDVYNMTSSEFYYRTTSGDIVGQPSNVQLRVNSIFPQDLDYTDVSDWAHPVVLNWLPATSGAISDYRVYVASSLTGPWFEMGGVIEDNHIEYTILQVASTLGILDFEPVTRRDAPFINYDVFFRVAAFNAENENSSVTVSAGDSTPPELNSYTIGHPVLENGFDLPELSGPAEVYLFFNEPVNIGEAGNAANYALSAGTVEYVMVMSSSRDDLLPLAPPQHTVVRIGSTGPIQGAAVTINVVGSIHDLAGNDILDGPGASIFVP